MPPKTKAASAVKASRSRWPRGGTTMVPCPSLLNAIISYWTVKTRLLFVVSNVMDDIMVKEMHCSHNRGNEWTHSHYVTHVVVSIATTKDNTCTQVHYETCVTVLVASLKHANVHISIINYKQLQCLLTTLYLAVRSQVLATMIGCIYLYIMMSSTLWQF
jgi:mannosyltransferase OCH1-like enzyme